MEEETQSSPLEPFECYKVVHAMKITQIKRVEGAPGADLVAEGGGQVRVDQVYLDRHKPYVGGYLVVYDDSYRSFSPVEPFERGYSPYEGSGMGWALRQLRAGKKVSRVNWNGPGMYICLQKGYPDGIAINKNTAEATGLGEGVIARFLPYLMIKTVDDSFVPWLASQTDILASDWYVVALNDERAVKGSEYQGDPPSAE